MNRLKMLLAGLVTATALAITVVPPFPLSATPPTHCGSPNIGFTWCPECEFRNERWQSESWTCTVVGDGYEWVWNWSGSFVEQDDCENEMAQYCPEGGGGQT